MCGIAGIVFSEATYTNTSVVQRLLGCLEHRGPDDFGALRFATNQRWCGREWNDGPAEAILLHRRLSIIDLTESGWQPMSTPDGRYHLVFNGEVYNYLEVRQELIKLGHDFRSESDTEVLLAAYVQWGAQALSRLVGMFAFAILDSKKRKLFLARDFFGIKPLYYVCGHEGFAFASELKGLLTLPWVSRRVNPERLYFYLRYGETDYGAETLFASISQLPPAHYLEVSLDNPSVVTPVQYWKIELKQRRAISFEHATKQLRDLFLESVQMHLRSDVPVGAALSGGIDSSSIVMAMRALQGQKLDLHTFSYIVEDPLIGEEKWVDLVGQASGAIVHKVRFHPEEMVANLDDLIYVQEEPFASTSIYAQSCVFRLAQQAGIKVMLDGQGADELLGGYPIAVVARLASLVRQGRLPEAIRLSTNIDSTHSTLRHPKRLWLSASQFLLPSKFHGPLRRLVGQELMPNWLNASWFAAHGIRPNSRRNYQGSDLLRQELLHSIEQLSLPSLLRYEDRNSMAHSIESRVPFLTPALAEFILSLPDEYLIAPNGTSKSVFREAMRKLVPDAILDRKDKIGFATPEKQLMAKLNPWLSATLQSDRMAHIGALNSELIKNEWQAIYKGQKAFDYRVWRWVNLVKWSELFEVDFEG